MALPIVTAPEYKITLPISKKEIKTRPFIVKEEKLILTAIESDEISELSDVIIQVLNNCTFNKLDIETLPITDIEWLLLKLRTFSKGEDFEINIECNNIVDGEPCGHVSTYTKSLNDVIISESDIIDNTIRLSENIGIKLRPPRANLIRELMGMKSKTDVTIAGFIDCIESIWDGEEVMYSKNYSEKELSEFVDQLTSDQLEKIKNYIDSLPRIEIIINHKCEKCGNEDKDLKIGGLHDFLG